MLQILHKQDGSMYAEQGFSKELSKGQGGSPKVTEGNIWYGKWHSGQDGEIDGSDQVIERKREYSSLLGRI